MLSSDMKSKKNNQIKLLEMRGTISGYLKKAQMGLIVD